MAALLWLPPAALAQVAFSETEIENYYHEPGSIAVADFNGDLDPDVAVPDFDPGRGQVNVQLGAAGDAFAGGDTLLSFQPTSVAVADFNHDSNADLAVGHEGTTSVSVYLGTGQGTFGEPATTFTAGIHPLSVAVGDFDGDSNPDLATANSGSENVSVLLGTGDGGFAPPTHYTTGAQPRAVVVSDFNGDSDPDLAVANTGDGTVSVLAGEPGGSFAPATNFPSVAVLFGTPSRLASIAVGDYNGDSDPDLAVANGPDGNVSVLLGEAGGTFRAPVNFAAGSSPVSVAAGDFNGDSQPDLAVANAGDGTMSDFGGVLVLLGEGDGNFGPAIDVTHGPSDHAASFVGVADLNRDSRPDLTVSHVGSGVVSALLNTTRPNSAPTASTDSFTVDLDTTLTVSAPGVLANDGDADGDALSAVLVSGPSHGTVSLGSDGSLRYTPDEDYLGADSFSYKASDGSLQSSAATVSLTVRPACDGVAATKVGTSGADRLTGTAAADVIVALGGNDTIAAAKGNDRICGGSGADSHHADAGDDVVIGGSGNDDLRGGLGDDRLFGGADMDSLRGDGGDDQLDGGAGSPDSCNGGAGIDTALASCEITTAVP